MDLVRYECEWHKGTPPNGEKGQFFGLDANGRGYILRWQELTSGPGYWLAVGWRTNSKAYGPRYLAVIAECRDDNRFFIQSWSPAPHVWDEDAS